MNSFALVAFFAVFAAANAGILAPSLYSAPLAYSAPVVSPYSASIVSAYGAPVVSAYGAPVVSPYAAPVVAGGLVGEQTVVAGPSGTIATGKTLATPGLAAYGGLVY